MTSQATKPAPHGTKEWAKSNVNIQTGCEHDCHYCYAKCMAIRFKRATPSSWGQPVLNPAAIAKTYGKRGGRIMFPTTHDITEGSVDPCLSVLTKLLRAGNSVLIVSKPHPQVARKLIEVLCAYKSQITFRFTIGSASSEVLRAWESGAPSFEERLEAIRLVHAAGLQTSVSCEPMLDQRIDQVIKAVRPYVTDSIWIGKANRLRSILAINSPGDADLRRLADQLIAGQSDGAIIDLYRTFRHDPFIKWKESIKDVAGLPRAQAAGLDT